MSWTLKGPLSLMPSVDKDGYREYKLVLYVYGSRGDGVADLWNTPGLPLPGAVLDSSWDGAGDSYAYCTFERSVSPHKGVKEGHYDRHFDLTFTFSTRPIQQCQDTKIDNPLLIPPEVSRSLSAYSVEATHDRFGRPILSSSHEMIRGSQVEWEEFRSAVNVKLNVLYVDAIFDYMNNTVNSLPLWGYPQRCIRFVFKGAAQHYYGQCFRYYSVEFAFEIFTRKNPETGAVESGWDRNVVDEGTKALSGEWKNVSGALVWTLKAMGGGTLNHPDQTTGTYDDTLRLNPDPNNPSHFTKYRDAKGEFGRVVLDGEGKPFNPTSSKLISFLGTSACAVQLGGDCPEVPEVWTVLGFTTAQGGAAEGVPITFVDGSCFWTDAVITLTPPAGDAGRWTLTNQALPSGFGASRWDATTWNCKGPNTMTKAFGDGPDVITLVWRVDKPGTRYVEKLQESNFLLLTSNLPLSL